MHRACETSYWLVAAPFRVISPLCVSGHQRAAESRYLDAFAAPHFLQERGWSSQRIGWAMGCYFLVNLVSRILAGPIADRYGNVPTALVGVGGGLVAQESSTWPQCGLLY